MEVAFRATFYIYCKRNKPCNNPDLLTKALISSHVFVENYVSLLSGNCKSGDIVKFIKSFIKISVA